MCIEVAMVIVENLMCIEGAIYSSVDAYVWHPEFSCVCVDLIRPYQVIFLFLIQLLSGNKCGHAQSKHTQAKKHWVISAV